MIKNFEPGTSPLAKRIEAAGKVARAGYPLGFIVALFTCMKAGRKDTIICLNA